MTELDLAAVERLLRTEEIGCRINYLATTPSTMDVARGEAANGAPHGAVVIAEEQTAGRGRFGRRWVSPAGKNLYLTLVLRPAAGRLRALSMMVPLAVCRAVEAVTPLRPVIKWPNDVLVGERKLAGVLIEGESSGAELTFALAGIGINVNDPIDDAEIAGIATSLLRELGEEVPRERVLAALLNELADAYYAPPEDVRSGWRSRIATLGHTVRLTFRDETYEGTAEDVDDEGSLILRLADGGRRTFEAGEVTLRR
ncbi:MAG TPA: biotin--[acetyl-CoA-carboxylase] ligase [Dehalococcoidia bacterium]